MKRKKILITGGHMTPAFAVIKELQSRGDFEFVWVGHKYNQHGNKNTSAEYRTVSEMGIKFIDLPAGKLTRNWGGNTFSAIKNLLKIPLGFMISFGILITNRPKLIISFGGYLALPISIVGWILRINVVTHEQTAVTGLTNKIIPKFAKQIFITWPSSAKYYPKEKTILSGNPIRPEVFEDKGFKSDINQDLPLIYITGGNQGSHKINQTMFEIVDQVLEVANVVHQTGNSSITGDFEAAKSIQQSLKGKKVGKYIVRDFVFGDEIGYVIQNATLMISRAGANIVYEVLATATPAIFIPIPWVTHNEQQLNAEIARDTGIATIVTEKELTPERLLSEINTWLTLINDNKTPLDMSLDQAKSNSTGVIVPNAAEIVVDNVWKYL